MQYGIIMLDDDGKYVMASRRVWLDESEAEDYSKTFAESRKPIVFQLPPYNGGVMRNVEAKEVYSRTFYMK